MVRQHHAVLADGASQVRRHGLQRRAPDSVHRLVQHRAGGEKENGDHLIRIEDRKIAIAYAIEALKLFDHFHFRVSAQAPDAPTTLRLQKPPAPGKKPWFDQYYRPGHVKERDRKLFAG